MTTEQFKKLQAAMPDEELIEKAEHQISELAKTGGKSITLCVPPEITDTDIILSEIVERYKSLISHLNDIPRWKSMT